MVPEDAEAIAANRQGVQAVLHQGEPREIDDAIYRIGRKVFRREELTAYEKDKGDIGGDSHVGVMRAITVRRGQRKFVLLFVLLDPFRLMSLPRHWICCLLRH